MRVSSEVLSVSVITSVWFTAVLLCQTVKISGSSSELLYIHVKNSYFFNVTYTNVRILASLKFFMFNFRSRKIDRLRIM